MQKLILYSETHCISIKSSFLNSSITNGLVSWYSVLLKVKGGDLDLNGIFGGKDYSITCQIIANISSNPLKLDTPILHQKPKAFLFIKRVSK